jgi:hypothetical protein
MEGGVEVEGVKWKRQKGGFPAAQLTEGANDEGDGMRRKGAAACFCQTHRVQKKRSDSVEELGGE